MFRSIIPIALLLALYIHCPIVDAYNGVDAFASETTGPLKIDPAMRRFLQNIANNLKKDWDPKLVSKSPGVLATFLVQPERTWRVYPPLVVDEVHAQEVELVEKELKGTDPPCKEPFKVLFVFDSWPTNNSTPDKNKKTDSSGTANEDVDFGPYMVRLQQKIKSNWYLSKEPQKKIKAIVVFRINKNGSIKTVRLTGKSKFNDYDKAALNAVKRSEPFLPLPKGSPDCIDIQYTFANQLYPTSKHHGDKRFTIHMSQPDVVITEFANSEKWGHFKTF
jgi:TonB family protein